ncbi:MULTISPECIES: hypothetical protein [Halorussus]|uniref:DUF7544 domain-containing protein n=1 Tax=Halorussus TaxID=1070314 RepID=UPI000E212437|nr:MULTISPECIES: hypothetical protein [Halorussus]NHN58778.1 hypothetical protein [Halorussus sp. JP-T4]
MSWLAVAALDDALDATKELLLPVDARQWLTLAVVVFFLGTGGGGGGSASAGSSTSASSGGSGDLPVPPGVEPDLPFTFQEVLPVLAVAVALALVVGLLYALVGSTMEFVFVESLRRRRVGIRRYASQHFGRAVRLFAFRALLGLVVAVPALGLVLGAVSLATAGQGVGDGLVLLLVPLLVVAGVLVALVDGFTVNFVVPVMVLRNVGVVEGWRQFRPALTDHLDEFGVYLLVRIGLSFLAGALASMAGAVVGVLLAVPLAILGLVSVPLLGGPEAVLANPAALAVGVGALLVYVALVTAAIAVAFVPVQTFLRYHSLFVLGDVEPDLDLIPELRRDVREGGSSGTSRFR